MSVPDIIKAVLEENGVTDYELRLGAYEPEEHVCQYRESDLDFISRWMEREGIFYFFEHGDDGEKLVLCDSRALRRGRAGQARPVLPAVRPRLHAAGEVPAHVHVPAHDAPGERTPQGLRLRQAQPRRVAAPRRSPTTARARSASTASASSRPSAGERLAKIRAEEMLARQVLYHGAGNRHPPAAGLHLRARGSPAPELQRAVPRASRSRHSGNQAAGSTPTSASSSSIEHDDVYRVEVDAIPAKTPVPRREQDHVAAHLRLRERHRRRPGRERVRADRRAGPLQRQVQVRREHAQERQGDDLGAHDAAARRRHRGLPLPAAQGDRGGLQLPRRRPATAR